MKLVLAIIKPHKLDEVREALGGIDVQGLTVSEARGYGRQKGHTEIYRGAEYETNLVPKIRVEVVVSADYADRVVETIQHAAETGSIGDGKIFVIDVERAVRIRTGELNDDALRGVGPMKLATNICRGLGALALTAFAAMPAWAQ